MKIDCWQIHIEIMLIWKPAQKWHPYYPNLFPVKYTFVISLYERVVAGVLQVIAHHTYSMETNPFTFRIGLSEMAVPFKNCELYQ